MTARITLLDGGVGREHIAALHAEFDGARSTR